MKRLYYALLIFLVLIIFILFNSIFFGDNNYSKRNELVKENGIQKENNDNLRKQNEILEFEIINAQNSKDHVENFAREKLNLTYPDEEFISFKKEEKDERE
mgnify:CR=1 FL=1|tara:strand:+ start:303 stop:605 length:303 start_codon:yes stop_codon:yes gene_type:complete